MIQFFFCMVMVFVGILYVIVYLPLKLVIELIALAFEENPKSSRKPDPLKSS